ncbi:MAG: glycosyltransferase [Candidatus Levybacteria bacterium]|nr:glycosyltransferase [Candidatus Levybacteria bacterium]
MIKNIDIILPTYHEQKNIIKVIKDIRKFVKTPNIITVVIQDKSDPTLESLKKIKNKIKDLKIIFTKDGIGLLKALRAGFLNTESSIIVTMMSDLSDNPKDIDKMMNKINEGYDLICASRYINPGKRIGGPKIKAILSFLACKSLNKLISLPTNDATNAYKCFKRSMLKKIKIESTQGFEMPLELTLKAFYKGFKIVDVPTIWRDREHGSSKFKIWKVLPYYLRWYLYGIRKKYF